MAIITTAEGLCNIALGKIGGAGDQIGGSGQIDSLSDTDPISVWCNTMLPVYRQTAILDMASAMMPFRETVKYADLGTELKVLDIVISAITVGAGPGYQVTIETEEAHGRSTGDKLFLSGIQGTDVTELNGTTKTITVVDTTSFTLDSTTGKSTYDHTADTGIISYVPEIGKWFYAFNLPSDMLPGGILGQVDEASISRRNTLFSDYKYEVIVNLTADGYLLLTNNYSNVGGTSAFIAYVTDHTTYSLWSPQMVETVAVLLAAELCPVVGRNSEERIKLLKEYDNFSKQNAKVMNSMQKNNYTHRVEDYHGGRTPGVHKHSKYMFNENYRRNWG